MVLDQLYQGAEWDPSFSWGHKTKEENEKNGQQFTVEILSKPKSFGNIIYKKKKKKKKDSV